MKSNCIVKNIKRSVFAVGKHRPFLHVLFADFGAPAKPISFVGLFFGVPVVNEMRGVELYPHVISL